MSADKSADVSADALCIIISWDNLEYILTDPCMRVPDIVRVFPEVWQLVGQPGDVTPLRDQLCLEESWKVDNKADCDGHQEVSEDSLVDTRDMVGMVGKWFTNCGISEKEYFNKLCVRSLRVGLKKIIEFSTKGALILAPLNEFWMIWVL